MTGTPASFAVEDAWNIEEQPPEITGVWFLLDGVGSEIAEQNKSLTIKFRATDDIALNTTGAVINFSWDGDSANVSASANITSGEYVGGPVYTVMNYSGVYSPTSAGVHSVSATVLDVNGESYTSSVYNFTSYGETTVGLTQNYSSASVSNVDLNNKGFVYVNYTVNNSGLVTAYSPTLTFTGNDSIVIASHAFGNLSAGEVSSEVVQMNVSELTLADDYNITATLTWTDADSGPGSDAVVFVITVDENKSFVYSPSSIIMNTTSGSSNSSVLLINNSGNVVLSSVNISCLEWDFV